jgi:recombination protein RecR
LLCVVETPRDVALFERAGGFRGLYHVLGGRLAPLDGVGPDRLTFDALVRRIRRGGVREVILATSPTLEGDGTALYAHTVLAGTGVAVTKLARGLPTGSSLELANPQMLADALDGRRTM